ncbi:MAG: DNA recombination protein RmuC [Patescibacteria group bacterium]
MTLAIIGIVVGVVVGGIAVFLVLRSRGQKEPLEDRALLMLHQQIGDLAKTLDQKLDLKLGESTRMMQTQFSQSAEIIRHVTERLTKLDETNRQVVGFADQLRNLQDILKNPKQRGVLGEYYLETVLSNVLPPQSYQMQYHLGTDEKTGKELIVDAVIFAKDKLIPVDSKFSLENYERILRAADGAEKERFEKLFKQDLKERIDETAKYIQPGRNTTDFAFMFIPSEAIYYDLLINKVGAVQVSTQDLIEYATKEKHVIVVSPTSFLAYLQTVLQGLRMLQIEESAKEIRNNVEVLSKHLVNYESFLQKMGSQLGTVVNTYNIGYREFKKIDKDITRISGERVGADPIALAKPEEIE